MGKAQQHFLPLWVCVTLHKRKLERAERGLRRKLTVICLNYLVRGIIAQKGANVCAKSRLGQSTLYSQINGTYEAAES